MTTNSSKYCSNCGKEIQGNENYCGYCGNKLSNPILSQKKSTSLEETQKYGNGWIVVITIIAVIILVIVFSTNLIEKKTALPNAAAQLYEDKTITRVSKAHTPENFVWGLGGWLKGADEIWCVTYYSEYSTTGNYSDLAVRIGNNWDRYSTYEMTWNMVSCGHSYE